MSVSPQLDPPRRPTRRRLRWVVRAVVVFAVLAFVAEALRVTAWTNKHTVLPGRVYRSAQPGGDDFRDEIRTKNIKTVINLRGVSPEYDWYRDEAKAIHDAGICQEDITLSANRLPPPTELKRLIEVLDRTEYPVLIHCKAGADRTGLAATIVLLLYTDATLGEARRQLLPRYGHFRFGRTAAIDLFFDAYETWLAGQATTHMPDLFRSWANTVYSPGPARSELVWLDKVPNPIAADKPFTVRVKATNRSTQTWEFKPGNYAGIHLHFVVADSTLLPLHRGQAGLLRASVPPGESIVLNVVVPPLKQAGHYALVAEMHDATAASVPIRANSFVQFGDESIMADVFVK